VIGAHVAPVMRASLPLRGIGVYVPAKDSDIAGEGLDVLSVKIGETPCFLR
jgi:hypothetical protein